MRIISCSLSAFVLLGLVASGCGGKDGSEVDGGNGTGAAATGGPGGGLNLGGSTGLPGTGTGTGTTVDPNAACAKGTASANLAGVNMFVMFDRSSSMNESAQRNGPTRWNLASAALSGFFASADAAGLNVALRFFPHDMPMAGCNGNQDEMVLPRCDTNACAAPLVPLGSLTADAAPTDGQEKLLLDAY